MRALIGGCTVLDSERGIMLHETGGFPALWFPREDFDDAVADRLEDPPLGDDGTGLLPGFAKLAFDVPERWFEEDDPVYSHVRDPYQRVDVRSSSRHVEIRCAGETVADSRPLLPLPPESQGDGTA